MVLEGCECAWAIEGLVWLPPHSHFVERLIRNERTQREFTIQSYWLDQKGYTVLSELEGISVWVDWKRMGRP